MGIGTLAFFAFALFVIHEFEEIIRVYPWITKHSSDPNYIKDLWISRKENYPSTEFIALMIGEEIILLSVVLTIGIILNSIIIVLAVILFNSIHLLLHLLSAIGIRKWNPGSITSLITLILNLLLLYLKLSKDIHVLGLIITTIVVVLIFAINIRILYLLANKVQSKVQLPE